MQFFARKAIQVRLSQGAGHGEKVPLWVVAVPSYNRSISVHHCSDVSDPIAVKIRVASMIRSREHPPNAASLLPRSAQDEKPEKKVSAETLTNHSCADSGSAINSTTPKPMKPMIQNKGSKRKTRRVVRMK
jgi:hypothetical protein